MVKLSSAIVTWGLVALITAASPVAFALKMVRAVKLHGRNMPSGDERAIITLAKQGKAEESLKECRRCLKNRPSDNHLKLLEAQLLRFLLDDTESQKRLEELRNAKDLTGEELEAAAITSDALEQWLLTKYFAEKGLPLVAEKDRVKLLLLIGDSLNKLSLFSEAEKNYAKALQYDKGTRTLDTLIYFYQARKKPNLVVKYCDLALQRNNDANSINVVKRHKFRGESLMQLGRYKQALADLDYCLSKTPNESYLYRQKAIANEKLGNKKDAEADKLKAIAVDKGMLGSD